MMMFTRPPRRNSVKVLNLNRPIDTARIIQNLTTWGMGARDPEVRRWRLKFSGSTDPVPKPPCPRWNLCSQGRCEGQAELVKKELSPSPPPQSKAGLLNHSLTGYKILGDQSFSFSFPLGLISLPPGYCGCWKVCSQSDHHTVVY